MPENFLRGLGCESLPTMRHFAFFSVLSLCDGRLLVKNKGRVIADPALCFQLGLPKLAIVGKQHRSSSRKELDFPKV